MNNKRNLTRSGIYLVKLLRKTKDLQGRVKEKIYVNANSPDEAISTVNDIMNPKYVLRFKVKHITYIDHMVIIPNDDHTDSEHPQNSFSDLVP